MEHEMKHGEDSKHFQQTILSGEMWKLFIISKCHQYRRFYPYNLKIKESK